MKKYITIILLIYTVSSFSQDNEKYQTVKTSQIGGRYEIVQSERSSVFTFKLDKHTGKIDHYVRIDELKQPLWMEIHKSQEEGDTITPNEINYQLILGGNSLLDCFLLNVNTGTTWILIKNSKGKFIFEGFDKSLD